eukprot:Lithocolla_globosa_v1_NODE_1018_length_2951_cov_19.816298.p2 type:complete len:143 gc:universal NODE_1018_length_2951_cov_19.816298:2496-2924(+)
MQDQGVPTAAYAPKWFLTFMSKSLPESFSARILDTVWVEGINVIFRFILCSMLQLQSRLLQTSFENIIELVSGDLGGLWGSPSELITQAYRLKLNNKLFMKLQDKAREIVWKEKQDEMFVSRMRRVRTESCLDVGEPTPNCE